MPDDKESFSQRPDDGPTPGDAGEISLPESVLRAAEERLRAGAGKRAETRRKIESKDFGALDTPERLRARVKRVLEDLAAARELKAEGLDDFESFDPDAPPNEDLLERIIGGENFLGVNFFDLGRRAARSVARIEIRTPGGRSGSGTGSMVSPRLLLTNNHVLRNAEWARHSRAVFDHEDDIDGNPRPTVAFGLEPDSFFLTDEALDFTLVAVGDTSLQPAGVRLADYGFIPLDASLGKISVGEFINIVQHPSGMHKQVVLQDNQLLDLSENPPDWLHYVADTLPGSSGAPLFNNRWEMVGLHHAGWPERDAQGRILTRDKQVWRKEMGESAISWLGNEGARVSRIVAKAQADSTLHETGKALLRDLLTPPKRGAVVTPVGPAPAPPVESRTLPAPTPEASSRLNQSRETPALPAEQRTAAGTVAAAQASARVGEVSVTIPLQITISLGGAAVASLAAVRPAAPDARAGTLSAALGELEDALGRPYYEAERDEAERESYYEGVDLQGGLGRGELYAKLSELLARTHVRKLAYRPALQLYPWVDLHPDWKLRSLYTGEMYEPQAVIEEALELEAEFAARKEQVLTREAVTDDATFQEELSLLEAGPAYNCEHVVPQSWFRGPGSATPRGDLHHLFTCQQVCNNFRASVPFWDFPDFNEDLIQGCGRKEGNKFEPARGKGPGARATLYFLLRYPGLIDDNVGELQAERVNTLLAWDAQEPVTEYERHRNASIYNKQGNRNPLIDFPGLAGRINFVRGLRRAV